MVQAVAPNIILASSSIYRKSLLQRLRLDFSCISPDIDESRFENESAGDYVRRLAEQKAAIIAGSRPDAFVIGSDQCAVLGDNILGKPGNHQNALKQLREAQGKRVVFHTGLCVMRKNTGFCEVDEVLYEVIFRQLNDAQLENYLRSEQPYQCAGSFRSEAYGITLFDKMRGDDPTALVGLPLIRLTRMLEEAGVNVV